MGILHYMKVAMKTLILLGCYLALSFVSGAAVVDETVEEKGKPYIRPILPHIQVRSTQNHITDMIIRSAYPVNLDRPVRWDRAEHQVCPDTTEHLVKTGKPAKTARMDLLVQMEHPDKMDPRVLREILDQLDQQEHRESQVHLVFLALPHIHLKFVPMVVTLLVITKDFI